MSPGLMRRLRSAVPVVVICVLVAVTWDQVTSRLSPDAEGAEPFMAIFIGVFGAPPAIFLGIGLVVGFLEGLTRKDFVDELEVPAELTAESMRSVELRGTKRRAELMAFA